MRIMELLIKIEIYIGKGFELIMMPKELFKMVGYASMIISALYLYNIIIPPQVLPIFAIALLPALFLIGVFNEVVGYSDEKTRETREKFDSYMNDIRDEVTSIRGEVYRIRRSTDNILMEKRRGERKT